MVSQEEKRRQMLTAPVELLVCKMAVPTIITMLITAFYNMADTYFVGQLDTVSTASVGLALPLMNVIQAIGFFFGHGSGNYMSRKLGEGDSKSADAMADTAVIMSMASGTVIALIGLILIRPLVTLLGATPLLMETSVEYISILLIGIPFVIASFTINNQLRFQGSAFLGMIGMASGSFLNVILDPIFIYTLDMKIAGAAIATVISQIISFIVLLVMSGRLPFRKPYFNLTAEVLASICQFGTPSLFRQAVASVAAICCNHVAGGYGEPVIAAVSVVNKIIMVGASVVIGFGQGFQPVCGFNNGAKRYDRVYRMFIFCIKASTVFMLVFGIISFIFSEQLVAFFRDDPEVISAGIMLLRFQCISVPLHGIIIMTNMLMQNMGKTLSATILSIARQGIFFIPFILLLPHFFGIMGVLSAQAAADVFTALVTLPMTVIAAKNLKQSISSMEAVPENELL